MPGFSMGQMGFSTRPREMTDGAAEKRDRKLPQPPTATPWDRMDAQQQARLNPMAAAESRDLAAATAPPESTYESYMAEKGLPEQQDIFSILSKPQVEPGGGVRRYGSVPGSADGANQRKAIQNAPRYEEYLQRDPKVQTYRQKLEDAYDDLSKMGPMDNLFHGKVQRQKIQALQSNYELALNDAKLRLADADSTYKASLPKYDVMNVGGGAYSIEALPNQPPRLRQTLVHPPSEHTVDEGGKTFRRETLPGGQVVSTLVPTEAEKAAAELKLYKDKTTFATNEGVRGAKELNAAGVVKSGNNVSIPGSRGLGADELLKMFDSNGGINQNFRNQVQIEVQREAANWPQPESWNTELQEQQKAERIRLAKEIADGYMLAKKKLDYSRIGGGANPGANAAGIRRDGTNQTLTNGTTFVFEPDPKPAPKKK